MSMYIMICPECDSSQLEKVNSQEFECCNCETRFDIGEAEAKEL